MKKKYIKYEKLSKEIRDEIQAYFDEKAGTARGLTMEKAMDEWFESCFDSWLLTRLSRGKEKKKDANNDKRKYFRLDVEIPITIISTIVESSDNDTDAKGLVGEVMNISRGGLYFKYDKQIEISSIIKVNLDLSDIDRDLQNVEALAMVVRVDAVKDNNFGIGIVFSSIYDENKESLDLFILKKLSNYIYSES